MTPSATPNVTMAEVPADRLEMAIADAANWLGTQDFRLVIDDRGRDERLRAGLERLGWERSSVSVYPCHVGEPVRLTPSEFKVRDEVLGGAPMS